MGGGRGLSRAVIGRKLRKFDRQNSKFTVDPPNFKFLLLRTKRLNGKTETETVRFLNGKNGNGRIQIAH